MYNQHTIKDTFEFGNDLGQFNDVCEATEATFMCVHVARFQISAKKDLL